VSGSKPKSLAMLPLFVRDYLAATRHMTLAERGAYTDLLFFSWDSGGPLPKDPARLAALINCTPKVFSTIWPSVREKFIETEAGYINERLEAERRRSLEMREKASEKASAAARAMWEKKRPPDARSNATSSASSSAPSSPNPVGSMLGAVLEQCPPSPSPSPSPSPLSRTMSGNGHAPRGSHIPDDFALTEPMREQALKRYPDCDVEEWFVLFAAHHREHGKTRSSWPAAWTTWIGNGANFGYPRKPPDPNAPKPKEEPRWR
jgi:uncharacterized protein YdaU (DUF1376 family)